jgi:hypothetical protein
MSGLLSVHGFTVRVGVRIEALQRRPVEFGIRIIGGSPGDLCAQLSLLGGAERGDPPRRFGNGVVRILLVN